MDFNEERVDGTPAMNRLRLVGTECDAGFDLPMPGFSETSIRALNAVEETSRLIDDLALQLGCLGHFDRNDGPRAA